jgi:hypothetical protein
MIELPMEQHYENDLIKIWTVQNKKYPYHAFCLHKPTGEIIEQAANSKTQAVCLVEEELSYRLNNNLFKGGENEKPGN